MALLICRIPALGFSAISGRLVKRAHRVPWQFPLDRAQPLTALEPTVHTPPEEPFPSFGASFDAWSACRLHAHDGSGDRGQRPAGGG